jgi:hypothetical protein
LDDSVMPGSSAALVIAPRSIIGQEVVCMSIATRSASKLKLEFVYKMKVNVEVNMSQPRP